MRHGFDTSFLVAVEIPEHPSHDAARAKLQELTTAGDRFVLTPEVLTEFVHVVTDPRRFLQPFDMTTALRIARRWWDAKEVDRLHPNDESIAQFFDWMRSFRLGRKRLLDTMLASTYETAGVRSILTTNAKDFTVLGSFTITPPAP